MSALNIATWLSKSKLLQGDIEQGECKELKNRGELELYVEILKGDLCKFEAKMKKNIRPRQIYCIFIRRLRPRKFFSLFHVQLKSVLYFFYKLF